MESKEEVAVIRLATGPQKRINEYRRFGLVVLACFGGIVCSFTYAWNLISGEMQSRYHLKQRDLSTIVTVGLVVMHCVLPYAFLYDYLGPVPIASILTVYIPLGTLLLALCFMGKITGSVVRLSVFNAMMSTGCVLIDLVCCMTVLSHFPSNRGPVIALLKTFIGLGSAIVGTFYEGFFDADPQKHFFFLFSLAFAVGALCIVFVRLPPYHLTQYEEKHLSVEEKERRVATKAQYLRQGAPLRRFAWGFVILVVLIIFLPTQSALVSYLRLGKGAKLAFALVTVVLLLLYPLIAAPLSFLDSDHIPFFHPVRNERRQSSAFDDADAGRGSEPLELTESTSKKMANEPDADLKGARYEVALVADSPSEDSDRRNNIETEVDYLAPQYQGSFFHNLRLLELWALWWTLFTVVGAEFVIIFNARFILFALQGQRGDPALPTTLTVLNGAGSAVGRLLMAYLEVWSQKRKAEDRVPLTIALFFPTTAVIIAIVLFLVVPARALPLPYCVAAMGNGFCAATQILVTRTLFAKDSAKHYHFIFTSTLVACLVFNRFLYGEWYTVQAEKQAHADNLCYGKKCVLMPLVVLLGLCVSAFITDVVVHLRYRSYCIKTLAERARLRAEAAQAGNVVDDGLQPQETSEEPRKE
ncbi:Protein Associated with Differentiation [Novymonas esmeraldas]|uniref:Protein Associated with Differentiation n=1 Tax=Novymonas esmeraldas TaxID=1808958 RepID=A0AAW0EKJ6_9TRYP